MDDEKELLNKNATVSQEEEKPEEYGDIRVATEVLSIVASLAAQEVPGVLRMSGRRIDGINEFLGKESVSKGVRVSFEGKTVTCNVYVIIEYGSCIPEVALEIQEKVKEAIESMTGYEVQFIDVHVQGVAKREKSALELEAEAIAEAGLFKELPPLYDEAEAEARHKQFFEED
ncbi:MAG: Asp23/Gls24 family envelope stress response protein [Phascolarctobacterium sp.]|nr:Asp23/Gls24 family envelope stress response protein [Phascolarctobacterium sp.]